MVEVVRTNSSNLDFKNMVELLDEYLSVIDGDEHFFYDKFNQIDNLDNVVVLYQYGEPVACGAIKQIESEIAEVKRMYTMPQFRGYGFAKSVLMELEKWAKELGFQKCVLETGKRMNDAVEFYKRCNYKIIPNYGQYVGIGNSICFEKVL